MTNTETITLTYIGIDIAKKDLEVSPFDKKAKSVPNTVKGVQSLITRLQKKGNTIICCEATGGYEQLLIAECLAAEQPIALVNARQVRDFAKSKGILVKTDKIDAAVLSAFGEQNKPASLTPKPLWLKRLASLLNRRDDLVNMVKQEKCRLDPLPPKEIESMINRHIKSLNKMMEQIEKAIDELMQSEELFKYKFERLNVVKSIGRQSALYLIGFMPELGHITDNQAAALAGLAPFCNDSGKMRGRRSVRGGRSQLRRVLYMAAVNAKTYNPILREFYNRLISKGKPAKVALTAVMRKLVILANKIFTNPEFKPI